MHGYSSAWADFDGDGYPDLSLVSDFGKSQMWWNNGNGTFTTGASLTSASTPYWIALADVNSDGLTDAVVSCYAGGTGAVSVFLGNGNGTFAAKTDFTSGQRPYNVALGDLDADTKPDIAVNVGESGQNKANVLLNTTALALSFRSDTLRITPPPVSTFGTPTQYVIHYNTQARITAGQPWGIWAKNWPTGKVTVPFSLNQTVTQCQDYSGSIATCFRPPTIGDITPGSTYVYRVYAYNGTTWSSPSTTLTVTRPGT